MISVRKVQLVCVAVLAFGMAVSCTSKKKEGGSSEKEEEEVEPSNPLPASPAGPSNPCLRLDSHEHEEGEDHEEGEAAEGDDTDTASSSGTSSGTGTDSEPESGGTTGDCGDTNDPPSSGGGDNYDVGPGIDGCKEQGAVWIAVKSNGSGKAGACGDPLSDYCCTEANVLALFPKMANQLKPKFDGYTGDGYKLYGCSTAAGKYAFHFGKGGEGASYKSAFVTGVSPKAGVTAPASCPAVTLEDMGFEGSVDTDTDTDTDTGTGTGTGTGSGTGTGTGEIPAAIGLLTDTEEEGLLTFLSSKAYQAWTSKTERVDSTATAGSFHADVDVKTYYNDKLKTSDAAWTGTTKKHKVESIAVTEVFSTKTTNAASKPKGWAVMAKALDEEGKASWLFVGVLGTGGTFPDFDTVDFKARGMGVDSCATCHENAANQRDFITTRAP